MKSTPCVIFLITTGFLILMINSESAKDRYQCYGKFPDLEEHKGANHGDVCRKKGMTTGKYRCPADCFKTKKGKKPFCQMSRKDKSACRVPPSCCTAVTDLGKRMVDAEKKLATLDDLGKKMVDAEKKLATLEKMAANTGTSLKSFCSAIDSADYHCCVNGEINKMNCATTTFASVFGISTSNGPNTCDDASLETSTATVCQDSA